MGVSVDPGSAVGFSLWLSATIAVAIASFLPTVREHWRRAGLRIAMIAVLGVIVLAPLASLAWATFQAAGWQRLLRPDHFGLLAFLPLALAWSTERLPWNPANAASRGLIFVVALYGLVGARASPLASMMLGDPVPPPCLAVALWPILLAAALGVCCGA